MKEKNDHRSKFSNLNNWKEEAWKKKSGLQRDSNPWPPRIPVRCSTNWAMKPHMRSFWGTTTVQIYELFHVYFTSFHSSREIWINKLTSLPICGFIAQLVEHCTGIRGGHGFEYHWSPDFFQASSFQLLKLENLLRWSSFSFIYYRRSNIWIIWFSCILHVNNWITFLFCSAFSFAVLLQIDHTESSSPWLVRKGICYFPLMLRCLVDTH